MSADALFQIIATAGGFLLAAITFAHASVQSRGKRFYERSIYFLDLLERFREVGPVTGRPASTASVDAHQRLLEGFEREARAHAALYTSTVARLRNPGSYLIGLFCLSYAVITAMITGSVAMQAVETGPTALVVLAGAPFIATCTLVVAGARLVLRRLQTYRIRGLIGEVDPMSAEGVSRSASAQFAFWRSLLRKSRRTFYAKGLTNSAGTGFGGTSRES